MSSGEFTFTDNQWYNFICGFFAGLKLKDLGAPGFITNTVLKPIGIGGSGKIGIKIGNTYLEDGEVLYDIPVYTHDVDVAYSGFTTAIRFRDPRVQFVSCLAGEFGTVGGASSSADVRYQYDKVSGVLYTRALRGSSEQEIKNPMILYNIRVRVSGVVYKSEKITLELLSNSYTDMNSTTLLKYVLVSGVPALYYITPLDNEDGYIYGNTDTENIGALTPISKPEGISMKASPSMIGVGSSVTPPGEHGVLPIYANSNVDDNFAYNKIHVTLVVEDKVIFKYLKVVGNGWSLSVSTSINSDGFLVIDIIAIRDKAAVDSCTFAYIDYEIDSAGTEYNIKVSASDGWLANDSGVLDVPSYDGSIIFPVPAYSGGGGSSGWGGGSGGCGGGGSIWSSAGGVVWISADGAPPYPVYLKPGWNNNVWWWIPFLFPDDRFEDVIISIEAPGYILIPAGFEWWILEPEGAPVASIKSSRVEGLKFKDSYDVQLYSVPLPTNLDENIDELEFDDVYIVDSTGNGIIINDSVDECDTNDVYYTELESKKYIEVNDTADIFDYDDSSNVELSGNGMKSYSNIESQYLEDVYSTSKTTLSIEDDTSMVNSISVEDSGDNIASSEVVHDGGHGLLYDIDTPHKRDIDEENFLDDISQIEIIK